MRKSEKIQFEQLFKIKNTADSHFNLYSEWTDHTASACKNMPVKILISTDITELAFPECIFHSYLKSLISYDASMKRMYSNEGLRDIYYEYIGAPSFFSKHVKALKNSYRIYCRGLKHGFGHRIAFTGFQRRFYDFLLENGIFSNSAERIQYAVPGHLVPVIISIIMAWNYSPAAFPDDTGNENVSFSNFQKEVFRKLEKFKFLSSEYWLFTLYFLHYYFNDECFACFQIPVFQRNKKVMLFLENEYKNYTNALYEITSAVPYLFLKKASLGFAYSILENNIRAILTPETEYRPCPETESFLKDFYKELKSLTNANLTESAGIMDKNLLKYPYTCDQYIIHIQPEKLQQYIKILTSRNDAYAAAMHGLCRQLERDIGACQKTLESGTYKAANMVRMQKTLNEFLSESNTLLAGAVEKHSKLLEQGITAVEKYKSGRSYKIPERLFTANLLYEDSFRIILDSISKRRML